MDAFGQPTLPMTKTFLAAAVAAAFVATTRQSPAAENLNEQLQTITTAVNSIPDIIFYKDLDGVYRGGNSAWATLLGKPADQLIGKTDFEIFPKEVAKSFQSYDKEMLASGKARRNTEWLVYPDGRRVEVETLKTPWLGKDGKVLGVLGICHEISPPAPPKPHEHLHCKIRVHRDPRQRPEFVRKVDPLPGLAGPTHRLGQWPS